MRYASINVFTVRAGDIDAFIALQRTAFLPLLRQQSIFSKSRGQEDRVGAEE